ncbi:transcriptional repressor [Candidatus Berkelbacteria bacterium]|nr:transcriptional repressor [Candidatus Berkelbacteria bacterium]
MEEPLPILAALRENGHRITPFREQLIAIFEDAASPLSARDITVLIAKKPRVHKTTLYRELEFLTAEQLITPIEASDGVKRFERTGLPHHHHFRCTNCNRIDDVAIDEKLEQRLMAQNQFATAHILNFLGTCGACGNGQDI